MSFSAMRSAVQVLPLPDAPTSESRSLLLCFIANSNGLPLLFDGIVCILPCSIERTREKLHTLGHNLGRDWPSVAASPNPSLYVRPLRPVTPR